MSSLHRQPQIAASLLLTLTPFFHCGVWAGDASAPSVEEISPWDTTINVKGWFGHKDNILFGHVNAVESPFVGAGLDALLWRLPENGWEFLVIGSGEYVRYWSADQVDHEAFAFAQAQARKDFGRGWKAGLSAEYVYFDQVVDVSATDREISVAQVQGHTFTLRPSLRRDFGRKSFTAIEAVVTRQNFVEIVDDEWQIGPMLTIGQSFGHGSEISASYQYLHRSFDTREARTASGIPIAGEPLEFIQQELTLTWRHSWDAARHWRTVTRLSVQRSEDTSEGYYDYLRPRLSQQLRYVAKTWNARADLKLTRYDYDVQPVSVSGPTPRKKTIFQASLRAEKNIFKSVKLFAEYEYERSISNLTVEDYRANTVLFGIDWEF